MIFSNPRERVRQPYLELFNLAVNLSHCGQQWVGVGSLCPAILHVHVHRRRGIQQLT